MVLVPPARGLSLRCLRRPNWCQRSLREAAGSLNRWREMGSNDRNRPGKTSKNPKRSRKDFCYPFWQISKARVHCLHHATTWYIAGAHFLTLLFRCPTPRHVSKARGRSLAREGGEQRCATDFQTAVAGTTMLSRDLGDSSAGPGIYFSLRRFVLVRTPSYLVASVCALEGTALRCLVG